MSAPYDEVELAEAIRHIRERAHHRSARRSPARRPGIHLLARPPSYSAEGVSREWGDDGRRGSIGRAG
jgi:hypothetical protein